MHTVSRWSAAVLLIISTASALSTPQPRAPAPASQLTIPLTKRAPRTLVVDDDGEWAAELGRKLVSKYNPTASLSKRGSGSNMLTNQVRLRPLLVLQLNVVHLSDGPLMLRYIALPVYRRTRTLHIMAHSQLGHPQSRIM